MKNRNTLIIVVLIVILGTYLLTGHSRPQGKINRADSEILAESTELIYDVLFGEEIVGVDKSTLGPLTIATALDNPNGSKRYLFISSQDLSGNGGDSGLIIAYDNASGGTSILSRFSGFFNHPSTFTFSPREDYLSYDAHWNNGVSCSNFYTVLVPTDAGDTVTLEPPVNLEDYPGKLDTDGLVYDPYVVATNLSWLSENVVQFDALVTTCLIGADPYEHQKTSIWQYNVVTEEYNEVN